MWTIRRAQLDALADDTLEGVVARITRAVAEAHPELCVAMGYDGLTEWVRDHVASASTLGVTHEENLYRVTSWSARLGGDTTWAEAYPWAVAMLGDDSEDEDTRVEAVELRIWGLDGDDLP